MTTETKTNISFGGSIPKIYDEVLGPVYFEPYAIDIAERAAKLNPASLLETACGTGIASVYLSNKIPSAQFISTDINPDMLAIAQTKNSNRNISWQLTDATALPFPDNKFDCMVTQFGVMFYPDRLKGMQEALRVLKPGGTFLFSVWGTLEANPMSATGREIVKGHFQNKVPASYNAAYSMHNIEEVMTLVKQAGFTEVYSEVVTKDCVAESAQVMAVGIVEGNPIVNAIREREESAIVVLKNKVYETLVERFGDHPCKSTMQAIVFAAKKK